MLRWRLFLGVLLIASVAALFAIDARLTPTGILVAGVGLLLAWAATGETLRLLAERDLRPSAFAAYLGVTLVVLTAAAPLFVAGDSPKDLTWLLLAFGGATAAAWLAEMIRYRAPGQSVVRTALAIGCAASIGLPLALLVRLRFVGPEGAWGPLAIASMIAVVKMADIGAYTAGRLVGRHKMAPHLSPGKTIEGAVGAFAFGCLGAWLARVVLGPLLLGGTADPGLRTDWLVYGLVLTAAGMLGDLAESLLKRDMNRKDSSHWMPGFGGVLDVIDSLLAAAPVAFVWWAYGGVSP